MYQRVFVDVDVQLAVHEAAALLNDVVRLQSVH